MPANKRQVTLTSKEIASCFSFSNGFHHPAMEKSPFAFGNSSHTRDHETKIARGVVGKIGEIAFQKYCAQNGVEIAIDFSLTKGRHVHDGGQDIQLVNGNKNDIKVDIKGTKHFAKWLLIESHKADPTLIQSDIYILVRSNLPKGIETNLELIPKSGINCEITGIALYSDLFDSNGVPWFSFPTGSQLIRPQSISPLVGATLQVKPIISDRPK